MKQEEIDGDISFFQNHSCDANTVFEGPFKMIFRKDVEIGEEITYDYATSGFSF